MSDTDKEEAGGCQACAAFEPQAWRKSLCRNCFHSLEEHSEELLAKEAEAVAKEKAEKASGKGQDSSAKTPDSKKADVGKSKDSSSPAAKDKQGKANDKSAEMDKDKTSKNIKDKFGANKEAAKDDGKWSWSKDLGREYGKPTGKSGADNAAVGLKGKSSLTTTASTTSSTTSSSSSSLSSLKSNLKSATSSSAAPTTPTPSTAATTSSTTSSSTTTTVSKAKNFASKFESKALTSTKDKPLSKPSDVVHVGPSVAAISGKLGDAPDSKGTSKSPDPKTDSTKSGGSKVDSKAPWKKPEDSKISETASKFSKPGLSKAKDDGKSLENKDNKKNGNDSKEKKSPLGKTEDKDSKFGKSSKASPFGKDMLKSTKDSSKKDSSQSEAEDSKLKTTKAKEDTLSKTKDSLKQSSPKGSSKDTTSDNEKSNAVSKIGSGKFIFDKTPTKKKEEEPAAKTGGKFKSSDLGQNAHSTESKSAPGASRSSRDTEQTDAGSVNKTGQLAKSTGKSADDKTGERPGGKDGGKLAKGTDDVTNKYQNNTGDASPSVDSSNVDRDKNAVYRDRGKEKGGKEGEVARQNEPATLPSSPVGDKLTSTAATSPSPSSKPTTPTTPLSSSSPTDSKTSSPLFSSSKSTAADKKPKDLKLDTRRDLKSPQSPLEKFKGLEKTPDKDKDSPVSSLKSPLSPSSLGSAKEDASKDKGDGKAIAGSPAGAKDASTEKLAAQLKDKEEKVAQLSKQLAEMEEHVKSLEKEKEELRKTATQSQKDDMEKMLQELRTNLSKMEGQCSRLETDNQALIDKINVQEASVKRDQECRGKNTDNTVLEQDLEAAEQELEDVKDENKELQRQIMEMKNEMDEMYDHFRENEHDEFRELQKELDLTAKNCRILQFKLRKAERRNDQIEEDRIHYEEKLRMLQDQFDSRDAKNHIRVLEEELRMAKEVSVRLHDELDIVEDKKNKAMEENRHLTELLEHTDKRQFRMEMEIDKLRDIVADLKQQLKEAKSGNNNNNNNNKDSSPDRKPTLGAIGKQGSKEYEVSQLMRDLCDSMERENDLKDQLKFTEEEAKMMRRRVSEMDEENENLRLQLQKMSEKASKHKKKEKERQKELEEERRQSEAVRAALTAQKSEDDESGDVSADVVLVVGGEGSDIISCDEPIPVSERKDSTDEDLMNVMQMRVQLEMLEQELMTSHKKLDEMDLENENLQAEVKFLQERLAEKEASASGGLPEPSTPNAYYEDKLKELSQEADELRWKLIEKDRELERLSVVQTRHGREHKKSGDKLKKSKSLESEADPVLTDLRRQLELSQMEVIKLKKYVEDLNEQVEELRAENDDLKNRTPVPSVRADDAAVENIELKDKVKKLEDDNKAQAEKIKSLTESLQKLSRDTRTYTSIATSPTVPGTLGIPGIPLVGPGTQAGARAGSDSPNHQGDAKTRDLSAQLHMLRSENEELRRLMGEWEESGKGRKLVQTTGKSGGEESGLSSRASAGDSKSKTEGEGKKENEEFTTKKHQEKSSEQLTDTECSSKQKETDDSTLKLTSPSSKDTKKSDKMEKDKDKDKKEAAEATKKDEGAAGQTKAYEEYRGDVDDEEDEDDGERRLSEEEPRIKSILLDYPGGKSKVTTTGSESRVELMEKVLDMDEEIGDLLSVVRRTEEQNERLRRKVKSVKRQLKEVKDDSRRTELELLQELDMLHDKNSVMGNLLDIINERAEAAEEELERRHHDEATHSPVRSASNVSQVSALSDTSMGSDEVFLNAHVTKEGVITRDWEAKLKVRIESLERLLAEERQKVSMAEKKLILAGIDTVSPSVSDDVKLRMREKELLQEELIKSQRHLHIATDQIQGLKERIHILEEEHERLKEDYGKLYDELDKPLKEEEEKKDDASTSDSEKTSDTSDADPPFVAKRISVVEAPKYRELKRLAEETNEASEETATLEAELAKYKQKAKELEYKVEEIDDIWRSKSAASDKEKDELEKQLNQRTKELNILEETIENLKRELCAKDKQIAENEVALREKDQELSRYTDLVKDREGESKKREHDQQTLLTQISQRDNTVRGLNETIRIRDERLREKDDILCKLNSSLDEHKKEMKTLGDKLHTMAGQLSAKDAEISVLRGQISSSSVLARDEPRSCQTDAEKESFRLKEALKKLQGELDKALGEKRILESTLQKSRKSLDDAMMMWDKERNELQKEANILQEKVRLYEVYNVMNKDETIDSLKTEVQEYFNEKESLVCELNTLKLKHESSERLHKEQMAKLQSELTDKLKMLKAEVDSNSHINTELDRLRRQAEMAYRLQQEQRVLKAEQMALKVRYETRIDKMSKEHNKMLLTIEKLQREHELDKQIIQGMQKNLTTVKDKYMDELLRLEEEKAVLHRQVKEIEESRSHLEELQKHIRDLREKIQDQDRLRSELINKSATDRSSWEIDRANLNSRINQLEEHLSSSSRQQERSKDIQVNMGMAWEKERREQRRLLAEAHTLALDLQEQLRSRDEAFAHERKELIRQMESDRLTWSKDKREAERKMMEIESAGRKVNSLHKRMKELEEKCEKEQQSWQTEKAELVKLVGEARHAHNKDTKKVEDVLSRLIKLRELGTMLTSQPMWDKIEEKPPDRSRHIDQNVVDYVKEAVNQVSHVADDLTMITNPSPDIGAIKKISNSEIDLLKDEFSQTRREQENVLIIADVSTSRMTTTTRIEEEIAGISRQYPQESSPIFIPHGPPRVAISETVTKSSAHTVHTSPVRNTSTAPAQTSSAPVTTAAAPAKPAAKPVTSVTSGTQPQVPTPAVVLRPFDAALSRRYDRPPSYTSGTRSAHSSRATTPEIAEPGPGSADTSPVRKPGFSEPPPSLVIPHHKFFQPRPQQKSALSSGHSSGKPKRPVTFVKSLSVDSAPILDTPSPSNQVTPTVTSISATTTPTQPVTSAEMMSSFSTPSVISPNSTNLSVSHRQFPSHKDKFSPRTARRKFFEGSLSTESPSSSTPSGYLSWPERRSITPVVHTRQQSLPNPEEVRREAEEEHNLVTSKLDSRGQNSAMKTSTSWDDKMHHKVVGQEGSSPVTPEPTTMTSSPSSSTITSSTSKSQGGGKSANAKEKRKLFKKSTSLDSTVGSSIANIGVSAMPPGAPTGFTPSELFSAVKGKLKSGFKRKQADSGKKGHDVREPSPLFIQTEVPDIHFASSGTTSLPVPAPHVDIEQWESRDHDEEEAFNESSERSRDSQRGGVPRSKWRSKSADRVQTSAKVHGDIIRQTPGVWKFNETAV